MNLSKNQQARARDPSRGRWDLRAESRLGTGKCPRWPRGPRELLGHHLSTSFQAKLTLSDHTAGLLWTCRLSTMEISPTELPLAEGHMTIIAWKNQELPYFYMQHPHLDLSGVVNNQIWLQISQEPLHWLTHLASSSSYYHQARGVTLGTVLCKVKSWIQWSLWVSLNSKYSVILWSCGPSLQPLCRMSYTAHLSKNWN